MASSTFAFILLAAAAADPVPFTELQYSGELVALDRSGERTPVKHFDLTCLVTAADQREVVFLVTEDAGRSVAWPERYGKLTSGSDPATSILVLYEHQERPQLLDIPSPYFPEPNKLSEDATWSDAKYRYTVVRSLTVNDQPAWQVEVAPLERGAGSLLTVAPDSGLVLSGSRRLTMGQGDLFELTWELASTTELPADQADQTRAAIDHLLQLQSDLGREDAAAEPALNAEQLATAQSAVAALQPAAAGTPFEKLAAVISRDVQAQLQRASSVEELANKFVGQAAPDFRLTTLDEQPLAASAWEGKTLVLHFWDYRDDPLEEPYGQVGYLDYLMNRHDNVVVYGVSVDRRLRDPATASQARRSIRKLKSFMNLGYDIALDADGAALKAFGDPTQFDAALPLWIVIAPDGKVAHYRTGFYEVDRDKGLADLDAAVSATKE
jgi:peroxiredoxin